MKAATVKSFWKRIKRFRIGILAYGVCCLFWLAFRSGTKPSRIAYPCQKAAASQSLVLFVLLPHLVNEVVLFLRHRFCWKTVFKAALVVATAGLATFSVSAVYDAMLEAASTRQLKRIAAKIAAAPAAEPVVSASALASPHRVVMVHDDDASWWHDQSPDYWNMIDQNVVDQMVYEGLMELTQTSSLYDAWRVLIPNYQPHQKIAIKVNNNNVGGSSNCGPDVYNRQDSNRNDSNAIIEPVNAIAKSLFQAFGSNISGQDIWVYESYRCFYKGTFMDRAESGIQFFCASQDADMPPEINYTGFSGTAPESIITFRYNPAVSLALNDVVVNADYLINIPIVRKHGAPTWQGSATLAFKNHFGSLQPDGGTTYTSSFHDARHIRTNNVLVDIAMNPLIREKTVLILGDAIIGSPTYNYLPPELWPARFPTEGTPEMLFFAVDPVAVDSVMADLLLWERGNENVESTRNYMLEAMDLGLGVAEIGTWTGTDYPDVTITYQNIDFAHINLDNSSQPYICLDTTQLTNWCRPGSNAPAQSFDVWNCGGAALNYSISDNVGWLSCAPASGSSMGAHNTIAVNYATSGLAPGSYSATITVADPAASNSPRHIAVNLLVDPAPQIATYPAAFDNSCTQGANALPQGLAVWNSGGGTLSYSLSDNAGWLSCVPLNGTSTGEADPITLNYTTAALPPGSYTAVITISDSNAINNPRTLPVELTVTEAPGLKRIACLSPPNESLLSSPPTFVWTAEGGTDNVFAVDLSFIYPMTAFWSTFGDMGLQIRANSWTMPGSIWDKIPSGSFVYWRVRGSDLDQSPPTVISSDQVWWFFKY